MQADTVTQQESMLEKEDDLLHRGDVLSHCAINTCTNLLDFMYFFFKWSGEAVCMCSQHANVILRQSSVHIKRNTSPPVTTQCYQPSSVCKRNRDRGWEGGTGGGVCLCQEYECLSASYAKLLSVFMCVGRSRVRVLTHCPGRDTAKTAVLVIRQFYFLKQTSNRD